MKKVIQFVIALLILAGAGVGGWVLLKTAPTTETEEEKQAPKIVQTIELTPSNEKITVTAWGTVIPAREVVIRPRVSGRIVKQNPALEPGGRLKKGEEIVQIDRDDYELALVEKKAELKEAEFEFEVEQGRQIVAKREYEQLKAELPGEDVNPALALREPYLNLTQAMVDKANNAIAKAELDLKRTILVAPFNSMVAEESTEIGNLVENGDEICRLVGTDLFWVQATLPMADLKRISLPDGGTPGAGAEVFLDTGNGAADPREGRVVRLLPDLEQAGRMARVLVAVDNPLGEKTPLLLGSYVRIEIEAGRLNDVLTIPRVALREGNRLWLVGNEKKIRISDPEVLWTRPDNVLVPNILEPGESLIVSELKSALPGMEVNPQPLEKTEK